MRKIPLQIIIVENYFKRYNNFLTLVNHITLLHIAYCGFPLRFCVSAGDKKAFTVTIKVEFITMRLWSLHPKHLDSRGLVALWREGLLAQAVLRGQTKGYLHHPQLKRFHSTASPIASIGEYLREVYSESQIRGFKFNFTKINQQRHQEQLRVNSGQLDYEWHHLLKKVAKRDPKWAIRLRAVGRPQPHPLFTVVVGEVEDWERV